MISGPSAPLNDFRNRRTRRAEFANAKRILWRGSGLGKPAPEPPKLPSNTDAYAEGEFLVIDVLAGEQRIKLSFDVQSARTLLAKCDVAIEKIEAADATQADDEITADGAALLAEAAANIARATSE
jgi:hypothetical protein